MKKKITLLLLIVGYLWVGKINAQCNLVADFDRSSRTICIGEPIVFYDLSDNGGDPGAYSWNWNFGTNATPATFNGQTPPTVTYSTAGTKTITLTYTTTGGGCTDVRQRDIEVIAQPTVSFTSNSPQCIGQQFNFIYTGSASLTYMWDFGIGASPSSSTIQNPQGITYLTSGTKTVTLTIDNGICTQTANQTVTASATPVVDFTSTAPKCTGETVDFLNTGTSSGVTYLWNLGSGAVPTTSTSQNPSGVVYSTSGSKLITLSTTNSTTGCAVTTTKTININQTPTATFATSAPVCINTAVNFTNTGSIGVGITYNWDFGSDAFPASSTAQSPTGILYTVSGNKTVSLTVINAVGCSALGTQNIIIDTTPTVEFTSTAPKCTGETVDFSNTGTTVGVTYLWNFGVGASPGTSTSQNPTGIIYSVAGIKTITLTATNSTTGCAVTTTHTINIKQTPNISFTSNTPVCIGSSVNFTNSSSTGVGITYNWDFGAGSIPANSTAQNPSGIKFNTSGSKTITLTVVNEFGCSASASANITIKTTPIASFTTTAPKCMGDTVDFNNTGTITGVNYSWFLGDGSIPNTSISENPTGVIYLNSGIKDITLTLTDTTSGCSSTFTQPITIFSKPVVLFTSNAPVCVNDSVNFINNSTSGTGIFYSWDFGIGALPANSTVLFPNAIAYSTSGNKTVSLMVSNESGCNSVLEQTIVIKTTPVTSYTTTAPRCTGIGVDYTNTGTNYGVTYNWDFGSGSNPLISNIENPLGVIYSTDGLKTVSLTLTDTISQCFATISQVININQTPTVSFSSTAPQCVNSGVNFINTGSSGENWTYTWDFGTNALPSTASTENPLGIVYESGGNKTVTFTITDGICMHIDTNIIFINSLPVADAGKDTTICADRNVQIGSNSINGYSYTWFPSSTLNNAMISNPVSSPIAIITDYTVTVRDLTTNCVNSDSIAVTMLLPLISNAGIDVEICRNEQIQIGAALIEGQTYNWFPITGINSTIISDPIASPDSTTTYTLSVSGSGCDIVTDKVTVIVHQLPNTNAGLDDTITTGAQIQLVATGGVQYEWTPVSSLNNGGIYNPIADPIQTTTYTVTVTDVYGCKNTDAVMITVLEPSLWLPNAFTPDGDGYNDVYFVRGRGLTDFEFLIFNRWGEQIFYTKNIEQGWDGKRQVTQEELPAGAYIYFVKGKKTNEEPVELKGLVNLIR